MQIFFKTQDPKAIVASIQGALGERELGKMVSFGLEGSDLVVTISKLGTSTLIFEQKPLNNGLQFALKKEKIALAHRAFKDEVTQKIMNVVTKAGGQVSA